MLLAGGGLLAVEVVLAGGGFVAAGGLCVGCRFIGAPLSVRVGVNGLLSSDFLGSGSASRLAFNGSVSAELGRLRRSSSSSSRPGAGANPVRTPLRDDSSSAPSNIVAIFAVSVSAHAGASEAPMMAATEITVEIPMAAAIPLAIILLPFVLLVHGAHIRSRSVLLAH